METIRSLTPSHTQDMFGAVVYNEARKKRQRWLRWLIASPVEQKKSIKNMAIRNMPMLEELEKDIDAIIREIDTAKKSVLGKDKIAKEDIISEEEIEAFFDSVSEEQALQNIAASNASINEDDREWARQVLRKQEA